MKQKTPGDIISAHSQADNILLRLREAAASAKTIEDAYAWELETIKEFYAVKIDPLKQTIAVLESDLEAFAKANKGALFATEDSRIDLQNGALTYTVEKRVKRIRDMLDRLENARRIELIKIAKSVDWDQVEKLDDADLAALGTKRQKKERFAYELKG
jgi:phage host-nuclease inhibitor protein Gam